MVVLAKEDIKHCAPNLFRISEFSKKHTLNIRGFTVCLTEYGFHLSTQF